jgi:hypothetical protein
VHEIPGQAFPGTCQPDCNNNGNADCDDIFRGSSSDDDANGVPDECEGCTYTQGYWKNAEKSQALPDFDYANAELKNTCFSRTESLVSQCISLGSIEYDCTLAFQTFCSNIPQYFVASYPKNNKDQADCAKLHRQLFAFFMNTFYGAIGDMPPYPSLGAAVPDSLLTEVYLFYFNYPGLFSPLTCSENEPLDSAQRAALVQLAGSLDLYNTGEYPGGVPHCDSEKECPYLSLTKIEPVSSGPCSPDSYTVHNDSECSTVTFEEATYHFKINCHDEDISIFLSDNDKCSGKKTQLRHAEQSCFQLDTNTWASVKCSGCPVPDPPTIQTAAAVAALTDSTAQREHLLGEAGPIEPQTEEDEHNNNPEEAIEIATLVFAVLAFVVVVAVLVLVAYYFNRLPKKGSLNSAARLTLLDHAEAQQKWAY